ncbi:hypothetical protein IMG5_202120 [Ichthyophthirius multifiliis]|uniref:Transmembrane protein n=1 Tax=Ichthyophthirius multifiliis TaxID=5932 RepID=G0R629_ICHMU|nr:hypothetical protein IMG5_202120 [Ichthyophthirius multifiliis]EGR27095.1 hypothetical protein IMG5_202120 [Ichthyophthirius multifiliis]|eukprot:XP_004023979.1 hypothetical protein IMG5_202120 [Ichthyophthirius multifiliis]
MGYEKKIPPPPTREQELEIIRKTEENFLKQPFYKYYMNEAHRTIKMEFAEKLNENRLHFWRNFFVGLLVTGPIFVIPYGLIFKRMSTGVPFYFVPKYVFAPKQAYDGGRSWHVLKTQVPLWIFLGTAYAYWFTENTVLADEWLEGGKIKYPF